MKARFYLIIVKVVISSATLVPGFNLLLSSWRQKRQLLNLQQQHYVKRVQPGNIHFVLTIPFLGAGGRTQKYIQSSMYDNE